MKKNTNHSNRTTNNNSEKQNRIKPVNRKSNKGLVLAGIFLAIILLIGIGIAIYANSLLGLIKEPEFTGDPSIQESDIVEPDQTVNALDSSKEIEQAVKEVEAVKKIPIPEDKNVYNILLVGTDRRAGEVNGRSDSMIILSINKKTQEISLVSLMRGLYVEIPGRGFGMLNASYSYGGPKLLLKTIEDNLRVKIDDYIAIDFSGFTKAINVVGGVNINLSKAEANHLLASYPNAGLKAGSNRLNGDIALAYARIRKLDNDFKRTGRQREVIEALIKKMTSLNVGQLDGVVRQLLPLVKTNKTGASFISLGMDALKARNYPISQMMLPIDGTHKMIIVRKMQMEQFDVEKNVQTLHEKLYGIN